MIYSSSLLGILYRLECRGGDGTVDTCLWCERPRFESTERQQCVPERDT